MARTFLDRLAGQFPAIVFLGPRQCGKTTLARSAITGRYFDLELPSQRQVFEPDPEMAIRRLRTEPLVFDELQTLPALFPVLRALIDEQRNPAGQFYLLGSVNPELVRGLSESLAGRVGILELTPFLAAELPAQSFSLTLDALWQRGGYPEALLAPDAGAWLLWCENYIRTCVERDLARSGLAFSAQEMRRLMIMIAHSHGGLLNASDLGRSMGVTYHTITKALDIIEGHFLIRRLQPYHANIGKRLVKAPKLYLRDSGLLHYLLGIHSPDALLTSPARGRSWEGFLIEQLTALERLRNPGSQFHFYRTHTGTEIDLIIDRGQHRIGYEFKCTAAVSPDDARSLRQGLADGIIHEGAVVYAGATSYPLAANLQVIAAQELLTAPGTGTAG